MSFAKMEVSRDGPVLVASLQGEIDLTNASEIADRLYRAVPNTTKGVVIDLSEIRYLDSRGVQFLMQVLERLEIRQQKACLVVPGRSPLRKLLAILSITSSHAVHTTVQAAIEEMHKKL